MIEDSGVFLSNMQNFRPPAFVRDGFRWRGRLFHLTYAYHIDPAVLLARVSALSAIPVLGTSIVHEESDAENPYSCTITPILHGSGSVPLTLLADGSWM